jgi:hypothetical protein
MRLMPNKDACFSEDEMQEKVALYFTQRRFPSNNENDKWNNKYITPKVYREVRIPQISRISDVIVFITERRIINIECKLADYSFVLKQAKDHLRWADYSYICFSPERYIPAFILDEMIHHGIGLLFWHRDYFVEVLQSGYNKNKEKTTRDGVLKILKGIDRKNTSINETSCQMKINL